jgi:uncharacterized protein YecA (UPF0149 family)
MTLKAQLEEFRKLMKPAYDMEQNQFNFNWPIHSIWAAIIEDEELVSRMKDLNNFSEKELEEYTNLINELTATLEQRVPEFSKLKQLMGKSRMSSKEREDVRQKSEKIKSGLRKKLREKYGLTKSR